MTNQPELNLQQEETLHENKTGCFLLGAYILLILWIAGVSVLHLAGQWTLEQLIFEGSLGIPDVRLVLAAAYVLSLLLPISALSAFMKDGRKRLILNTWRIAAVFPLLTLPVRLLPLTAWQSMAAAHLLVLFVLFFLMRRWLPGSAIRGGRFRQEFTGWQAPMILAALIWIPWVIWGAMGSWLDSLLGLLTGLGLGAAMTLLLQPLLSQRTEETGAGGGMDLPNQVLAVFVAVLIFSGGFAMVGLQYLFTPLAVIAGLMAIILSNQHETWGIIAPGWGSRMALIGLIACLPLVWVDGDELMLVIGIEPGETLSVALILLGTSLALGLAASALLLVIRRRLALNSFSIGHTRTWGWAVVLAWMITAGAHLIAGQPGFYGEKLFVVLRDQTDLTELAGVEDPVSRREAVYAVLTAHAHESQTDLVNILSRLGIEFQTYYLVDGLEVNGGPLMRLWLNSRPEVGRVLDSPQLRPVNLKRVPARGSRAIVDAPMWNLTMIQAQKVWEEFGVRGAGILIGQSDSGVDGSHPELADAYLGRNGGQDYHWFDPWNGSPEPQDFNGHGTHTLGTILGNRTGVAPDAEWIGCVNLARNLGNPAYYLDCMQFMLAPFPAGGDPAVDGEPARGAHILNNSWGCPWVEGCDAGVFHPAVNALREAGVFVVASAGNSGYGGCGSINSPLAVYEEVISVGAVDEGGNLADFSSLGPVTVDGSMRLKPDLVAPGEFILSAYPGATYEVASGTSMAGPHVAGVVALMWSANPDLIGQIDITTQILLESAQKYSGELPTCASDGMIPNNGSGYGIVDAYEAVKRSLDP